MNSPVFDNLSMQELTIRLGLPISGRWRQHQARLKLTPKSTATLAEVSDETAEEVPERWDGLA